MVVELEVIDPFYDAEEEKRALEQGARNEAMRDRMRKKRKLDEVEGREGAKLPASGEEFLAIPSEVVAGAPWRRERLAGRGVNGFVALHEELVEFDLWLSHSEEERKKKEGFLEAVKREVAKIVESSECVVFGSWYTGLCLPDSDLDVSIRVGARMSDSEIVHKLKLLADSLLGEDLVEYVEIREKARIPLLVIRKGECEMDITICAGEEAVSPLGTSDFILYRGLVRYPQMRPLILFLKVFLQQRALQDTFTGGVGSYLLSCMVLAFLQHKESRNTLADLTLGHLLFDFLTFFTKDLNTNREGLSVNGPGARFVKAERRFEPAGGPAHNRPGDLLCVESPLEPHIDIGGKAFQWRSIKQAFMQARLVIVNALQAKELGGSLLAPGLIDPVLFAGKLVDRPEPPAKRRRLDVHPQVVLEQRRPRDHHRGGDDDAHHHVQRGHHHHRQQPQHRQEPHHHQQQPRQWQERHGEQQRRPHEGRRFSRE